MHGSSVVPSNENPTTPARLSAGAVVPRAPYGPLGGYPGSEPELGDSPAFVLLQYWRILNRRKWLILGVVTAFMVLGAVRTLMMTPLYAATARIQIDRTVAKIVQSGDVSVENEDSNFLK